MAVEKMITLDQLSNFKRQVFIQWYPSDWLSDPNVTTLPPVVKAFWVDLICRMHFFFPYGHCSKLSIPKLRKVKKLDSLKNFSVESLVNQNSNREDNLWVTLSVLASVDDQLKVVENMEDHLHKFLPYSKEEIKEYIAVLVDEGVASKTDSGILYSRRMHKDFRKRVTAFLNGSKGGNPHISAQNRSRKPKNLLTNDVSNLVNLNSNQGDDLRVGDLVGDSVTYNYNLLNQGIGDSKSLKEGGSQGETIKGKKGEEYLVADVLGKPWAELRHFKSIMGNITEKDFLLWKEFVGELFAKNQEAMFVGSMVNPEDFTKLVKSNGFTRDRWQPIVRAILGSGVLPQHKMFFRIPQFMEGNRANKLSTNGMDTGGDDYEGQTKW